MIRNSIRFLRSTALLLLGFWALIALSERLIYCNMSAYPFHIDAEIYGPVRSITDLKKELESPMYCGSDPASELQQAPDGSWLVRCRMWWPTRIIRVAGLDIPRH